MSEAELTLDEIAQALAELARRIGAIEQAHETLAAGVSREREVQRHTLTLLAQLMERQTESLKRAEEKFAAQMAELAAPRRQAIVKGKVVIAKPKPPAPPPAPPPVQPPAPEPQPKPADVSPRQPRPKPAPPASAPLPTPEPEIEQQISEAIGNISAMLRKKEGKRRKNG